MSERIGFVGLGNIGRPMALRLADWPGGLTVADLDAQAVAALEEAGARSAESLAELAAEVAVCCVMVRDDAQVEQVLDGLLAGAREGLVVVVHSTVAPDTPARLAERAAPAGVRVVDAPVSGGAVGAADGRLAIMVGGEPAGYEAAAGPLQAMGELVVHAGPIGAGTRMKLARNLLHFVAFTAVTESQRLAEEGGLDLVALGQVVRHTDAITGGPGAIMHRETTAPIAEGDPWREILGHVVELGDKDLRLAIELAEQLDVDVPLARLARQRLAAGLGLPDHAATT